MMRVIARHATVHAVAEPSRFCVWVGEVAVAEAAEGWAAPVGDDVQVWFEGSPPAVEAMLDWCATHDASRDALGVTSQRPALRGGFDILEAPPGD